MCPKAFFKKSESAGGKRLLNIGIAPPKGKKRKMIKQVYHRLRDLREDHDLSQKQVALVLNMSQTGYSKYETGENDIPTQVLILLSRFYNVSVDYLLGETDCPRRTK